MPFQFMIGGRGIGKTYSVLHCHYNDFVAGKIGKILYLRITDKEYRMSATKFGNPYKKVNADHSLNIRPERIEGASNVKAIVCGEGEEVTEIGYMACLASFDGVRGVDFSDVEIVYIDEFMISEMTIKTASIKRAGWSFLGAYETIARNRELLGMNPVRVICTANSFSLDSPILEVFEIVEEIVSMIRAREQRRTFNDRGIYIELAEAVEVSEAKATTALYKAIGGSGKAYASMALKNQFNDKAFTYIKRKVPLNEYLPVFNYLGDVVYRHKSNFMFHVKHTESIVYGHMYDENSADLMQLNFKFDFMCALQERRITFDRVDSYYRLYDAFTMSIKK